MLSERLKKHFVLGVDIDHTLINGPSSFILQDWIKERPKGYSFHLVTFRTGKDYEDIWNDLSFYDLDPSHFQGVHGIPKEIGQTFWGYTRKIGYRNEMHENKWIRACKHHGVTTEDYLDFESQVAHWKGSKCSDIGATALIDDLEYFVLPGCNKFGVEFIDAINP